MTVDSAEVGEQREVTPESRGEERDGEELRVAAILREPAAQRQIERTTELFLVIGVGFGLTGLLVASLSGVDGINTFAAQTAMGFAILLSPLLGAITGILTAVDYEREPFDVLIVAGVGAGLGSLVASVGLHLFAYAIGIGGAGSTLSIGALIGLGIGTGITAALAALVTDRVE